MKPSVYQKLFGNDFEKLGKNLRYGHSTMPVIKATGKIDVEWGKNPLVKWICKLQNLPPEGNDQPLELEVTRDKNIETWKRKIKDVTFITTQFAKNGLLVEKDGPLSIGFQLKVENGMLIYQQVYTKMMGIRMPGFLSVKSKAQAIETDEGWKVTVQVTAPIVGLVLIYNANVQLI